MIGPSELADFRGAWTLSRDISDRRLGRQGTLAGTATLSDDGEGLLYVENGTMQFPDAPPLNATRRYLWRRCPGGIAMYFEDGRPFHEFSFGSPAARHLCAPDTYDVAYDFSAWPRWKARWEVTGPQKAYTLLSRYAPAG